MFLLSFSPSNTHGLAISLSTVDRLSSLLDRSQHGIVGHGGFGDNVGGLGFQVDIEGLDTLELLQDSFHGTGATATAHADVELVLVVGHGVSGRCMLRELERERERERRWVVWCVDEQISK